MNRLLDQGYIFDQFAGPGKVEKNQPKKNSACHRVKRRNKQRKRGEKTRKKKRKRVEKMGQKGKLKKYDGKKEI